MQSRNQLADSFILDDTPFISYYQEALARFQNALSGNEKDAHLYTTIADSLQAIGHHNDAVVAYVQAITLNPSMKTSYYGIAKSLYYLRHSIEALRVYAMALQHDANNTAYAYMSCSMVIKQLKYDKEAQGAQEDALKIDSTIQETYLDWEYALLEPVQPQPRFSLADAFVL
jgi:tetratricopeptide (TPR) repeat protein